jgi:methyl-accepting chemotaxis protein
MTTENSLGSSLETAALIGEAMGAINRQIGEVVSYSVGIHKSTGQQIKGLEGWHQMMELHLQSIGQALGRIEIALGEQTAEIRALKALVVRGQRPPIGL